MRVAKVCAPSLLSTLLLAAFLLPIGAPIARAGVIDPAYEAYLNTLPADQQVSVLLYLADQAPISRLDAELRAVRAALAVRHETVITALMDKAAETQPALLADLAARQDAGEVGGYTPYWIANLVVAQMTVRAVREVAARPEVGVVYANFTASLIEPVGGPKEGGDPPVTATTPGVRAINAPRVWNELGITGAGRLVCGLDTGVMGSHTALASRWRGAGGAVPWQHCWLDRLGGGTQFPTDGNGHGTHTMGTMVGLGAATQDSIGVAWRAKWIACNAIAQGVGSEFDNDVIAAFQWIADPDGNPQTTDDVPDVVQNSWRINENFPGGYTDCDPRWWAVMDGCEAAGCAVVFSAGNEGPGAMTIGSPPDRITTPTNAFAIGAVDATNFPTFPYPIANFSSRGPSGCDGVTRKPEVVGPGVAVRSSWNSGGYTNLDGTSMSGPHVSGIFALMREANPNIDVASMKQILMDTARDEGVAGEDNTYGWGMVDAYAAVIAASTGFGELMGNVNSSNGGYPIPNAQVRVQQSGITLTTDQNGHYQGLVGAGTVDLQASHSAFETATQNGVEIIANQQTVVDWILTPLPDAVPPQISGIACLYATENTSGPYPIDATVTDNLGFRLVSLFYRVNGGAWVEVAMAAQANNRYSASIPGQPLGTDVDYYVQARDAQLNTATAPPGAPGSHYSFVIGTPVASFADDVELDRGWTLGVPGDNATSGRWERGDPPGTFAAGVPIQPEDDHTPAPGVQCFVTGLGNPGDPYNVHDLDGGCTTLLSPRFDLSGAQEAVLSYWRWWAVLGSPDSMLVDISSDDGATWVSLEHVTGNQNAWNQRTFSTIHCMIDLTATMRVRFKACDLDPGSIVEAAVDDVTLMRFNSGSEGVAPPAAAPTGQLRLASARPNPFNPVTLVSYEVPERGKATLRIYDVKGRLVRTLADGLVEAGLHSAVFDGRNEGGHDLASGTYFLRLAAGGREVTQKLSLVR